MGRPLLAPLATNVHRAVQRVLLRPDERLGPPQHHLFLVLVHAIRVDRHVLVLHANVRIVNLLDLQRQRHHRRKVDVDEAARLAAERTELVDGHVPPEAGEREAARRAADLGVALWRQLAGEQVEQRVALPYVVHALVR